MGRRTHKKQIPPDVVMYKGKPWTPLMIMEYLGITRYKYNQAVEGRDPTVLLEWGAYALKTVVKKHKADRSVMVKQGGKVLTLQQWFYLVIKDRSLFTEIPYSHFKSRLYYYMRRANADHNESGLSDGLHATLRSLGHEHLTVDMNKYLDQRPKLIEILESGEYLDVIQEYHERLKRQNRAELTEQPENANDHWFRCLLADTRLHWLFVEEYEKQMQQMQSKVEYVTSLNATLNERVARAEMAQKQSERAYAELRRAYANARPEATQDDWSENSRGEGEATDSGDI